MKIYSTIIRKYVAEYVNAEVRERMHSLLSMDFIIYITAKIMCT